AQQVCEQQVAQATPAQDAAADQQAHESALLVGVFLARCLLTLVVFFLGLTAFAQQVCEQQVAQATPAQDAAADQQAHESALLVGVFLARCLLTLVVFFLGLTAFAQQVCEQQV